MIQSLPRCDDYGADDNDDAGDNKEEGTEAGWRMMIDVNFALFRDEPKQIIESTIIYR